jgi:hypothetical protein
MPQMTDRRYVITNSSGNIIRATVCSEEQSEIQAFPGEWLFQSDYADESTHYMSEESLVAFTEQQRSVKEAKPSWPSIWSNETMGWVDLRTLDQTIAERWNEIKQEKIGRETGLFTIDGRTYQCNEIKMSGATTGAFMAIQRGDTDYRQFWVLNDNSDVMLTADEVIAMGIGAKNYITSLSVITQALRAQLEAATTPEEVAAVVWPVAQ